MKYLLILILLQYHIDLKKASSCMNDYYSGIPKGKVHKIDTRQYNCKIINKDTLNKEEITYRRAISIFDTLGNVTSFIKPTNKNNPVVASFEYNHNLLTKLITGDRIEKYTYNKINQLVESTLNKNEISKYFYKNDSLEKVITYQNNKLILTKTYRYTKNSEESIDTIIFDSLDKHIFYRKISYDYKNNKVYETAYSTTANGKEMALDRETTFDNDGNEIEIKDFSRSRKTKYLQYDKKGNWIKCITFFNDTTARIDIRQIEYYK